MEELFRKRRNHYLATSSSVLEVCRGGASCPAKEVRTSVERGDVKGSPINRTPSRCETNAHTSSR